MMSKEDDDLAKAIALSLEEANVSKPALVSAVAPSTRNKEDEDLERAITESLKDLEAKRATATQNVEAALRTTATNGQYDHAETAKDPNELSGTEAGNIRLFSQLVEKLEQEAAIRGAGAAVTDTSIQVSTYAVT